MFDDSSKLINELGSPLNIASMTLDELESRLGGDKIVADPNSAFCFLLEFGSSISAACARKIDETLPLIYPKRARNVEDLYRHMSDYDYLRMYATPSTTTLMLMLPKKYLSDNALDFNDNYKKVTIPKDTVFTIGKYPFGIHYPIDILINKNTNTFTVAYDTSETDPLQTLAKNIVDKYDQVKDSLEYIVIEFPIYQFAKSIITESVIPETGFSKSYLYNNYFYAVRVFSVKDDVYTEFHLTQSESVYDTSKLTALMRVLPDEQKFKLIIPQIYLDNNLVGTSVYIELYTTLGDLNINTTNIDPTNISIAFGKRTKDTNDYSALLQSLPFDSVVAIRSGANIQGGSNPIDTNTLRDRVVNNTLYDSVPITAAQVEVYLNDNGFTAEKYQDNVTSRIWNAYRTLEDTNGRVIPSRMCQMLMYKDYPDTRSAFIRNADGTITVLPTAIYQYDEATDRATPLDDDAMRAIAAMDKTELAEFLNNGSYFKSPFHMHINLSDYYPQTVSYNLMTPSVDRVIFQTENYYVPAKMVAYEAAIQHLENGTGGYRLSIAVYKSDDLADVDLSALKVYVCTKTTEGFWIGGEASYFGSSEARDFFRIDLATNYLLTEDDEIAITSLRHESMELQRYLIPLQTKFYLVFMAEKSVINGSYQAATGELTEGVPGSYFKDYVGIARQYLEVSLGHSLKDVINHEMELSLSAQIYATYDHDVPAIYEEDVYKRKADGTLDFKVNEDGTLRLVKLHYAGEEKKDDAGNVIYLHRQGDVRYDASGKPVVASDRIQYYGIDFMLIDAKVFASERSAELGFVNELYATLEGYFNTVRNLQAELLEQTYVYFKCINSTGTAKFHLGDNIFTRKAIELSFKINCYVPSYVKGDAALQNTIKTQMCEAINAQIKTKVINMREIFTSIKEQMSDYVEYFDLLGINGDASFQTCEVVDDGVQPSLRRVLVLTEDNILSLEDDVDINFITLEDNTAQTSVEV